MAVESEPGFGATFTVRLPTGRAHLADDQTVPAAEVLAGDGTTGPAGLAVPAGGAPVAPADEAEPDDDDRTTVLVADDNADIRAYVRGHLEGDYRVVEAADGDAALALARAETPDLIVSDVMMPGLDGVALVAALRADPDTDFIPVVLLTAKAEEADVQAGLDAGADAYVVKPFDVRTLRSRVAGLIASRHRLRARFGADAPPDPAASSAGDPASADAAFVGRVRAVVLERLGDEDLSVEAVAEAVGVSRSTLHRRLRETADETPSAFLRHARLGRAAGLLAESAGTVSEVAYAVGFRSVSHFSRSSRQRYGVSPSAAVGVGVPAV